MRASLRIITGTPVIRLAKRGGERRVFGCQNYHQEFYIGYVAEAENLGLCVTGSAA